MVIKSSRKIFTDDNCYYFWGYADSVIFIRWFRIHFNQLGLALAPGKYIWKKLLSHSFFGVAGKLCFGFYLIHFTTIEVVYSGVKAPVYTNERAVVSSDGISQEACNILTISRFLQSKWASQIFWWTLFFGFFLTLFVELPAGAALKELLDRRKVNNKVRDIQQTQGPAEQRVEQSAGV